MSRVLEVLSETIVQWYQLAFIFSVDQAINVFLAGTESDVRIHSDDLTITIRIGKLGDYAQLEVFSGNPHALRFLGLLALSVGNGTLHVLVQTICVEDVVNERDKFSLAIRVHGVLLEARQLFGVERLAQELNLLIIVDFAREQVEHLLRRSLKSRLLHVFSCLVGSQCLDNLVVRLLAHLFTHERRQEAEHAIKNVSLLFIEGTLVVRF